MTTTIDGAFIANFEAEVHIQYQMMGSKLRNTVRMKDNIQPDHSVEFQRLNSDVRVACLLQDYYAGDWIDLLEDLKTNIVARAGAYALGRKSDELIVDAMMDAKHCIVSSGKKGMGHEMVQDVSMLFDDIDMPDDGQRFAVVGWKQWSELLNIQEFVNADNLDCDELPWKGTQAKRWLNTIWFSHSWLPKNGNVRSCFWYHKTAVGHAIGSEVKTEITWHGDRAAHFVNNRMAQGACLIDPSRVVRMQCVEV